MNINKRIAEIEKELQSLKQLNAEQERMYRDDYVFVTNENGFYLVRTRRGEKRNYMLMSCKTLDEANYLAQRYSIAMRTDGGK